MNILTAKSYRISHGFSKEEIDLPVNNENNNCNKSKIEIMLINEVLMNLIRPLIQFIKIQIKQNIHKF